MTLGSLTLQQSFVGETLEFGSKETDIFLVFKKSSTQHETCLCLLLQMSVRESSSVHMPEKRSAL